MYRDSEIGVVFHHGMLSRSRLSVRVGQLLNILFSVVYGALATRFLLTYVHAPATSFGSWLTRVTDPVYVPLRAFVADGHDRAGHPLAWGLLIAIALAAVLQACLIGFLHEISRPRLEL